MHVFIEAAHSQYSPSRSGKEYPLLLPGKSRGSGNGYAAGTPTSRKWPNNSPCDTNGYGNCSGVLSGVCPVFFFLSAPLAPRRAVGLVKNQSYIYYLSVSVLSSIRRMNSGSTSTVAARSEGSSTNSRLTLEPRVVIRKPS